jgi:hypothetical protein
MMQSDCKPLTEGKSYGGRRVFADEKVILMSTLVRLIGSLKANLDKKMISKAIADYKDLKQEFRDAMFGILESYTKGQIADEVLETMWRSEIKGAWDKAYEYGVRSVGNPFGVWEQDKTWLAGAEREEFGYLGKFVEDIKAKELVMKLEDRLSMYIETLDGVYFHGQVEGSPEFVEIHWILGKSCKHCDDCLKFEAGSPYTKASLPCVPRDGTSECLSHCQCTLEYKYSDEKPKPDLYMIKGPAKPTVPEGYRLPSEKERDKLSQMSTEIDRLREMIKATSGAAKKEYIHARRDLNADLINFMEKHKIYYVPGGQVEKVKFVESIAEDVKQQLLLEGGPGSGFYGHKGSPGHVGGSLSGGTVSAHAYSGVGDWVAKRGIHISASESEKKKMYDLLNSVPTSHLKLSDLKTITVMNNLKEVNELYYLRSGEKGRTFKCDAFYDHNSKEMVLSPGSLQATVLHEFAHTLVGLGAYKKQVWDANASTGKVTRYGSTNMDEGFCEAYAMRAIDKTYLRKRAPAVADVMDKVFEL